MKGSSAIIRITSLLAASLFTGVFGGGAVASDLSTSPLTLATSSAIGQASVAEARDLQERNALHIREGVAELEQRWDAARHKTIDSALRENATLLDAFASRPELADVHRVLRRDRVVALRARGHAEQAVALFERIAAEDTPPAYVQIAAGDAYMLLRQPLKARERYAAAIEMDPAAAAGVNVSLAYAHLESEDFRAMDGTLSELLAQNPGDAGVRRLHARLLRFSDRLGEAQAGLDELMAELPGDVGLAMDAAGLAASRGLPRKAHALYARVLASQPENTDARVGLAETAWVMGDHVQAQQMLTRLLADAPEHPAVRRFADSWERAGRALLTTEATFGRGSGRVSGNDDLVWDTYLYSPRLAPGVRVFAHDHRSRASFSGERVRHERGGVGVELVRRNWSAAAEIGAETTNGRDAGLSLSGAWQPDDHWTVRVVHETRTDDLPLKGRLKDSSEAVTHLHADRSLVGLAYRWNESRRVAIDVSHYDFNDGNRRHAIAASWFERLISQPGRTLDLQLGLYSSRNSLSDTFYFNPKRDYSASATLTADALVWRHYGRRFNHRVSATFGSYRQISDVRDVNEVSVWRERDYGWKPYQDVRYEHEWQFDDDLTARYGIGTRRFAYDGEYERKHYFYFMFNWRF